MALYTLAPQPWLVFLDGSGLLIPNGQLAIYAAGTSTPATTYTSAMGTAHPFPITLDGHGLVPGGLYLEPGRSYKVVLYSPQVEEPLDGAVLKTQDDVAAVPASGVVRSLSTPGAQTALDVAGATVLDYVGAGDVDIRGLAGGVRGQELTLVNRTAFTLTVHDDDPAAAPGDRLRNRTAAPALAVGDRSFARYLYLGGAWRMIGWGT